MLQFKLRTMLLFMVAVALVSWVMFVLPDPVGVLVMTGVLATIPGIVAAGVIYCRGYSRAFYIGAAGPQVIIVVQSYPFMFDSSSPLSSVVGFGPDPFVMKAWILATLAVTAISGVGAVLMRYLASGGEAPHDDGLPSTSSGS